ncbi:uncharacterized protein LOC111264851 isoform X2 [Varroa jacobsoni]|uniref:uncharacterized protein LOC111264851 isoform X2 n=1 Tax=Varroa jacobsoni TaxID=62625 RepID=UPI000BF9799F|nr:uncharacterized protein LOC111264851 isoform X2 [Varroa jacobsoni]
MTINMDVTVYRPPVASRSQEMCGTSTVRPPPLADGKEPIMKEKKKEKRRNSEKRKEKSRDAARCRRGKESEIFNEMLSYLPLTDEVASQLDKMSILRLTLISLRLNRFLGAAGRRSLNGDDHWLRFGKNEDALCVDPVLDLMGGFLMILMEDGESLEPIFVSDGIHTEMGLLPAELLGVSLEGFVHPCDYQELRDALADLKTTPSSEKQLQYKTLQIRMKCTITAKGRVVNIKSAAYKVVKYQLRLLKREDVTYLTAVCEPMGPFMAKLRPTKIAFFNSEVKSGDDFISQHDLRFVFKNIERLPFCFGYSQNELRGQSLYNVIHPQDMATLVDNFKELFNKGYCDTGFYRFLASRGGYCWVSTKAQLVQDTYGKPLTVHCVHSVLGDIHQPGEVLALFQKEACENHCPTSSNDVQQQQQQALCSASEELTANPTTHTQIVLVPSIESRHAVSATGSTNCYVQVCGRHEIGYPLKAAPMSVVLPPLTTQHSPTVTSPPATSLVPATAHSVPSQPQAVGLSIVHAICRCGGGNSSNSSGSSSNSSDGIVASSSSSSSSSSSGSGSHHVLIFAPSGPCRSDGGSLCGRPATCSTSLAPSAIGRHIGGGPSPMAGEGTPANCPLSVQSLSAAATCAAAGDLCSGQASPVAVIGQSKNNQLDNNNSSEQQQHQQHQTDCTTAAAATSQPSALSSSLSSSPSLSRTTFLARLVVNNSAAASSSGNSNSDHSYQPQSVLLQRQQQQRVAEGKQIQQQAARQVTTSVLPATSALVEACDLTTTTTSVVGASRAGRLPLLAESPTQPVRGTSPSKAHDSTISVTEAHLDAASCDGSSCTQSRFCPSLLVVADGGLARLRTVAEQQLNSSSSSAASAANTQATVNDDDDDDCGHRRRHATGTAISSNSGTAGGCSSSDNNSSDGKNNHKVSVILNHFDHEQRQADAQQQQQQNQDLLSSFVTNTRLATNGRKPPAAASALHSGSNHGLTAQDCTNLELCAPLSLPPSLEQASPPPPAPECEPVDSEADCVPGLVSSVDDESSSCASTSHSNTTTTANTAVVQGNNHFSCAVLFDNGDAAPAKCESVNSVAHASSSSSASLSLLLSCVRPEDSCLPNVANCSASDERELTSQVQPPKAGATSFDRALTGIDRFLSQQHQHHHYHRHHQQQQEHDQRLQEQPQQKQGHHAAKHQRHHYKQRQQQQSQRYEEPDLIAVVRGDDCDCEDEVDKWTKLWPSLLAPTTSSVLLSTSSTAARVAPTAVRNNQSSRGLAESAAAATAVETVDLGTEAQQIAASAVDPNNEDSQAISVSTSTLSVFAPRTEEMSPGFLQIKGGQVLTCEEPGLDLTHLAPTAGDSAMPLDVEFEINEIPENLFPNLLDSAGCSPLSTSPPYDDPLLGCGDLPPALLEDLSDNLQLETDNLLLPTDWPLSDSSSLDHPLNSICNGSSRSSPSTGGSTTSSQRDHATKLHESSSYGRSTTTGSAFSRSNNSTRAADAVSSCSSHCSNPGAAGQLSAKSAASTQPSTHLQISSKPMLAALLQSDLVPSSVSQKQRAMVHDWGGTTQPLPESHTLSLPQSTATAATIVTTHHPHHRQQQLNTASSVSAHLTAAVHHVGNNGSGNANSQASPKRAAPVKFVPQKVQSPLTINSLKRPLSVSQRHHHSASDQSPHRTASFTPLKRRKTLDELQPKPVDKSGSVLMKLLVNGEDLLNGYSCRVVPRQGERDDSKDSGAALGLGVLGNGKTELRSAQDFLCSLASQLDHAPASVGSDASDFCHLLSADDDILMALAAVTQE